jgi:hypothetical protein
MAWVVLGLLLLVSVAGVVSATLTLQTTVIETFATTDAPFGESGKLSVTHSGLNESTQLNANSAAGSNVTQCAYGSYNLTAGAGSINLAAAGGFKNSVVDLTGLKIRQLHIRAKATNVNPITITKGAANGYTGFGAAFSLTLDPGKAAILKGNATAVAAAVRLLDLTGTGTQGVEYMILAGDN